MSFGARSWFPFAQPLPGSALHDQAEEHGRYLSRDLQAYSQVNAIYVPSGVSTEHLIAARGRGMRLANPSAGESKALSLRVREALLEARDRLAPHSVPNELERVRRLAGPIGPDGPTD